MLLSDVKLNQKARVLSVNCVSSKKLQTLGLSNGTIIQVVRKIGKNNLLEISLRGFFLVIRKETAEKIKVEIVDE